MRIISTLLAIGAFASVARGQELRGRVVTENMEALPGATVVWLGTRSGTIADGEGSFVIGVPPGATRVIASYAGFRPDTIVYSGQRTIEFVLREGVDLGQVEIEGEKESTELSLIDPLKFQTLGQKELCKAACCNLSESFETNASIDASFTDAITGTRQIRMLGLDGKYTQIMFDNVPAVRGLASTYGLTYVPGPWINTIQISKGTGSVLNGYESISGQINVSHKSVDTADPLHVNAYAGSGGRLELNVVWKELLTRSPGESKAPLIESRHRAASWGMVLLAHGATSSLRTDMNNDGFLDNPLFTNIILRNEWSLKTDYGLGGTYAFNYLHLENVSGKREYDPADEIKSQLWGVQVTTDRYEFNGKTGYVFPKKEWKSFGSQVTVSWHDQQGHYGYRSYVGQQLSTRVNLLYATELFDENNRITAALTGTHDDYTERLGIASFPLFELNGLDLSRKETVAGVALEDSWNWKRRMTAVVGIRADYHNQFGLLVTPRVHIRYSTSDKSSIKLLAGKGYRTPNIIMDQVGMLASNRQIVIEGNASDYLHGLKMEEAWNVGLLFASKFKMRHRDAQFSVDVYRTQFDNQVVADMETPELMRFYNLDGKSYSNSAQAELQWSPIRRLEWRIAYRWMDVKTQYDSGLLEKPLVNKHRAFTNLAYETKANAKGAQWRWDATLQWISRKRIPMIELHEGSSAVGSYSDSFVQLNSQITYVIRKDLEVYLGGENLTNFIQRDAIAFAENPSDERFDASLIWGPVFGRMGYVGMRWTIR